MPTYNANFALLRFGGSAWNGAEQWSCGLKLKHLGGDAPEPLQQECVDTIQEVADILAGYVAQTNSDFGNHARLNWVKLNCISATDGKYYYPNEANELLGLNNVSNSGPGIPQVALCVTMRGHWAKGPASRGRYFIPCGLQPLENDGQLSTTWAEAAANRAGIFLAQLGSIDSGLGPDAWQPWLYGDGIGGSRDSAIVRVEVGRIYDTQRRRRNTLIEDHQPATNWPVS